MRSSSRQKRSEPPLLLRWLLFLLTIGILIILAILLFGGNPLEETPATSEDPVLSSPSPSPEVDPSLWNLLLVNMEHPLADDFSISLTDLPTGGQVDSRIYSALMKMMDDAQEEGLSLYICSSYRSQETQERLFENRVDRFIAEDGLTEEEAREAAAQWVALPGTSEHQSGLAVDIVASDYQILDETQESTPEQQWLIAHCWEYGFILRYPSDKAFLTGISYEPWHYRYVGVEAAKEITERGICLEEYLDPSLLADPS